MSQQVEANSSELRCVCFLSTSDLYHMSFRNLLYVAVLTLSANEFPVGHMLLPVAIYIYVYIYIYICCIFAVGWFPGVLKSSFNYLILCVAVFKISFFTM